MALAFIYTLRLFYLQVINDSYKLSANNNVLRNITEFPARGLIYDRKGKLLVYNEAVYDLMIVTKQVKNLDTALLCDLIGIKKEDFEKKIKRIKRLKEYSPVRSVPFEKQLSAETYARFQEKLYKFPGFYVQARTIRKYPQSIAAHLLGYIGEVDEKYTEKQKYYRPGDYIGISGIEQSYEKTLRGQRGTKIVMVDVFNRIKGSYKEGKYDTIAVAGENLTSSIDAELQALGEKLMSNKIGSIIAVEPSTGEVLSMVCGPTYDPNLLVGRVRTKNYAKLVMNPYKPLFNRALMAMYPPGSTFKPVMAMVGLQEGVLTPQTRYNCPGGYYNGSKFMKCEHVHGSIDLDGSIAHSCNTYYLYTFKAILDNNVYPNTETSFEKWRAYMLSFGIGMRLPIDLPSALKGSMPTVAYYNKYHGKGHWKSSTIISLGIGQGEMGLTPLQMVNVTSVIANRGYYYTPHVIKGIGDNKRQTKEFTTKHQSMVSAARLQAVVDAMEHVVTNGTAAASRIEGISLCGKTGTAQNTYGENNSLFIAFAPKDKPRIAISVVVENAGYGASWAAPIASLMIEKYLTDTIIRKELMDRLVNANLMANVVTDLTPKVKKKKD